MQGVCRNSLWRWMTPVSEAGAAGETSSSFWHLPEQAIPQAALWLPRAASWPPLPGMGGGAEPLSLSLTLCPVGVGPIDLRACSLLPRYLGGKQGSCLNSQWSVRAGVATVQSVPAGEQLGQGRGFPGWVTGPGLQAPEPRLPVSKCTEDLPDLGNVCSVARPGPTGVS